MLVISSREFRDSQKKYLELAKKDRVIVKRNNEFIELVHRGNLIPDNPSPSHDPYFDNQDNITELKRRIEAMKEGTVKSVVVSKERQKELLGL